MSALASQHALPRFSRFAWLMGLYGENHLRLTRLFDPLRLERGRYLSSVGDGLDVRLDIIERHPYTLEIRLTYALRDPVTGEPDPSAFVRMYRDARQAEVTHCYVGRHWQDVLGLRPSSRAMLSHRLRMNAFLNKWLDYLADQGHSVATLNVADAEDADLLAYA